LRRLSALEHFRGEGVYRTNYAERMCDSRLQYGPPADELWPYISAESVDRSRLRTGPSFEQPAGVIEPPIRVDWKAGRVVTVSEVVPVRNHPCTYAVYSLESLSLGVKNDLNFEAPFAFYDLSGTGSLYP